MIASKKRNLELNYLNPRKLLRYITGKKIIRDRLQGKNRDSHGISFNEGKSFIKRLAIECMVRMINILGREDHVLILARKNEKN